MQTKTTVPSKQDGEWHFLSAEGRVLGDIATEAAKILLGKNTPTFARNTVSNEKVVVTDAAKVVLTGNKESDKTYWRHSSYPGGLRAETAAEVRTKDPRRLVERAVWGMLPTNKLRKKIMTNLYIYPSAEHPHEAQAKGGKK